MALRLIAAHGPDADWQQLRSAIETGDLCELEQILAGRSVVNFVDDHGVTPLMHAVRHNQLAVARFLIEHGANVNAVRSDGFTALLLATFFGYRDLLQTLVESGANLKANTRFGTSAQTWATARGFYDIAEYLQQQQDKLVFAPFKNENQARKQPVLQRNQANEELKPAPQTTLPRSIVAQSNAANSPAEIAGEKSKITEDSTTPPIVRRLKNPPEIWDLVNENPTDFHAGSTFLSRIISAKPTTIVFTLAAILILVMGTLAGLALRADRKRSTAVEETSASSGPAEVNRDAIPSEPTQTLASPNENPVVKPEASESLQPKLESTQSESFGSRSLVASQRIKRQARTSATAQGGPRVNDPIPASEDLDKTSGPQKSLVESTSNETRVTENSPPVKRQTDSTTNSQLITRPFGSRVKPKTIQWP
jgi:uncharacterized protein